VSEEFKTIGLQNFYNLNFRMDQKCSIIYRLTHALRGLHFIGKPHYLFTPKFLARTEKQHFKLVLPFFMNYFDEPGVQIFNKDTDYKNLEYYYPPEIWSLKGAERRKLG